MKAFFLIPTLVTVASAQQWFRTGQDADLMLSGSDFNNTGGALLFNHRSGIASDGTHFLLCDRFNNRVLSWNALPTKWDPPPDLVPGQHNFIAINPGTSNSGLNFPGNVSVGANGVVTVADTENDRIPQSKISSKVFHVFGREVATLVEEYKEPGICTDTFDTQHSTLGTLASGVYFNQFNAGSLIQTKKMSMMRSWEPSCQKSRSFSAGLVSKQ